MLLKLYSESLEVEPEITKIVKSVCFILNIYKNFPLPPSLYIFFGNREKFPKSSSKIDSPQRCSSFALWVLISAGKTQHTPVGRIQAIISGSPWLSLKELFYCSDMFSFLVKYEVPVTPMGCCSEKQQAKGGEAQGKINACVHWEHSGVGAPQFSTFLPGSYLQRSHLAVTSGLDQCLPASHLDSEWNSNLTTFPQQVRESNKPPRFPSKWVWLCPYFTHADPAPLSFQEEIEVLGSTFLHF